MSDIRTIQINFLKMSEYFKNNLVFLRELKGENQTQSATALGLTRSTYANYEIGENEPKANIILKIIGHFGVSFEELMSSDLSKARFSYKDGVLKSDKKSKVLGKVSGKFLEKSGESEANAAPVADLMPKVITVDSRGEENMVLVPIKAAAGYLNGHGDMAFIQSLPAYRLPGYNNGTFRMFEVKGASMHPTLNEGDICICKWVESLDSIRNDRIHVVISKSDGIVVKRVLNRVQTDNKLILKSDNIKDKHEYPNMIIEPSEVLELWYVVAYISHVMKSPSEIYNRVIDLEGRLTIMDDKLKKAGL